MHRIARIPSCVLNSWRDAASRVPRVPVHTAVKICAPLPVHPSSLISSPPVDDMPVQALSVAKDVVFLGTQAFSV